MYVFVKGVRVHCCAGHVCFPFAFVRLEPQLCPDSFDSAGGEDPTDTQSSKDYEIQVHSMRHADISTLYVDFQHVQKHDDGLAGSIQSEYIRLEPFLRDAVKVCLLFLSLLICHHPHRQH